MAEIVLCPVCGGNGTLKIHHGVATCDVCSGMGNVGPGFLEGFAAGQAAERKRIDEAPRAWFDGNLRDDGNCLGALWRERIPESHTLFALVPLSPTPQQESEPDDRT